MPAPLNILLVKTSSLGDVIHNLPVATELAREFPGARIDWVVEENFAAIPALHPAVRRVIPVAIRRWRRQLGQAATWRELRDFWRNLRQTHYDAVLDTQGLLKSALITRAARGWRLGHAAESAREPLAAWAYQETHAIPRNVHAVARNRWLAAAAFDYPPPEDDSPPDYGLGQLASGHPSLPPAALLITATSRDDKLWPDARWIALGRQLNQRGLMCLLPAGSARERQRALAIAAALPQARVLPPSDLPQLAHTFAECRVAIGVDTGLTHLAAALAVPTVAIYCASVPGLTGVCGQGFFRNLGQAGAAPQVAEVLAACDLARLAPPLPKSQPLVPTELPAPAGSLAA